MTASQLIATAGIAGSCVLAGAAALLNTGASGSESKLTILAASSLSEILVDDGRPLAADVVFAASGLHYQAVAHGRPFDMMITAKEQHAERLVDDGVARTARPLATGSAVLVTQEPTGASDPAEWIAHRPSVRIVIPNPRHAPFGASAAAWLEELGIAYQRDRRFVVAQSVESAMSLVARGAVDAAFGAEALAPEGTHQTKLPGARPVRYWCVVSHDAPPDTAEAMAILSDLLGRATVHDAQRTQR